MTQAKDKAWLAARREELRRAFLKNGDENALLSGHAGVIDTLLQSLWADTPAGSALLATGGYGRGELYPYSDIDLLFLYAPRGEKAAEKQAAAMLYTLWDLGLKVGHAVRSAGDTLRLAEGDTTTRTALIDMRFLAGDQLLLQDFEKRFYAGIVEGGVPDFVERKLAERDARHKRFGDSRYLLEPNVKEGKGGLRDAHTLWWLARYAYPIESLKDLVGMKLIESEEYRAFDQARRFLSRVRIHLHYLTGRAEERLTFEYQQKLAEAMGYGHNEATVAIERFMRRYFTAARTIGGVTRIVCAMLEEQKKRAPRLAWLKLAPWKQPGFVLDGGRLAARRKDAFEKNPLLMLDLFRIAQKHDLDIHPAALRQVARNLKRVDRAMQKHPKANAIFLDILLSSKGPETALKRMNDAGLLGRFIPEFGRIVGQTQFNRYHIYTVDEHTLVALGVLTGIEQGRLKAELPVASDAIRRVQQRRVLFMALFCHDLAKGKGDHSAAGEKIARRLSARCGFSAGESETVAWLVRHHLAFSDTAYKRDLDDPKTIADFVSLVQTPERLRLLFLLTVADIRAVGPHVWNSWKATLLRELYARAERALGTGETVSDATALLRAALPSLLPGHDAQEIAAYLAEGDAAFLSAFPAARHAGLLRLIRDASRMELPLAFDTAHDRARGITEITLCTGDQKGLFSKLAGAMTLAGANIAAARIHTLKNGMAVDVFQLQDAAGTAFDRPDRLARMAVNIERALSGDLDLAAEFARRKKPAARRAGVAVTGQVFIDNEASHLYTVIEFSCADRPGLLYEVTGIIAAQGLSIAAARIATYGAQASDVFYVKNSGGRKVTQETKLHELHAALEKAAQG